MISPPSKEQFNSRPEDSWPLFSLEFFWHGSLTELRVSDFSPETGRFIQLQLLQSLPNLFLLFVFRWENKCERQTDLASCSVFLNHGAFTKLSFLYRGPLKVFH